MSKSHNKKRNVGIIYELLLRNISGALVSDDKKRAQRALSIIERRFDKSTELYREFRLFNALAKSTVSDTSVAAAILTEAKQAARRCNIKKLDKEKSLLIRDINHNLLDKNFYHRRIPEYKLYATIQTLLNEWRLNDKSDLSKVIQFESKVVEYLLEKKDVDTVDNHKSADVDALVVKIMTEKINKKYTGKLSANQKNLLQEYVFSISKDRMNRIHDILSDIKESSLTDIKNLKIKTDNVVILEKIDNVSKKIQNESLEIINDDTISRFLVLMNLKKEISEALNE